MGHGKIAITCPGRIKKDLARISHNRSTGFNWWTELHLNRIRYSNHTALLPRSGDAFSVALLWA
jgi:hypothetical protein